jgi:hypothetical protein
LECGQEPEITPEMIEAGIGDGAANDDALRIRKVNRRFYIGFGYVHWGEFERHSAL